MWVDNMVESISEFTDDELECIDNKLCIKSSKKLLTGNYVEYYKNGNVKRRIEYKNGILDGVVENFREDGKLIHMETWKDKDLHGFFKTYDEKYGSVSTGYFNNRHESGEWDTYDKNGVLVVKLVFDDKGNLLSKEEIENEEYYKIFQFDKKE